MARIYPFQGYRYNREKVGALDDVVTQPYDKIPDALREEYLARHPCNIVRVIRNPDYAAAGRFLRDWIEEGVLLQEAKPSLYIYEQEFELDGRSFRRLGMIALVSLEDPDLQVHGHERVLDHPLADRLRLIRETQANEGLIFTLFSDPRREADGRLRAWADAHAPAIEVTDDFGVRNRLWAVSDSDWVESVRNSVLSRSLYIADGHHRFQTSVLYHRECVQAGLRPVGGESFDKRMVALFNMESEGLEILPTHRGVKALTNFSPELLRERLAGNFVVEQVDSESEMVSRVESGAQSFGWVVRSSGGLRCFVLTLRPGILESAEFLPGSPPALRSVDVAILHEAVLGQALGISAEKVASEEHVEYFRSRKELLEKVASGELQTGFVLKATPLRQVREVSEQGLRMPQKSTDFYPKLLTGLVLMKMRME